MGGEGNPGNGAHVYRIRQPNIFIDYNGTTFKNYTYRWRSFLNGYGAPDIQKRLRSVHLDMREFEGKATISIDDIDGQKLANAEIKKYER